MGLLKKLLKTAPPDKVLVRMSRNGEEFVVLSESVKGDDRFLTGDVHVQYRGCIESGLGFVIPADLKVVRFGGGLGGSYLEDEDGRETYYAR